MISILFWSALFLIGLAYFFYRCARFGDELGRDIARYQISQRYRRDDLERRIRNLEAKK